MQVSTRVFGLKMVSLMAASYVFVSCGKPMERDASKLDYIVAPKASAGLTRKVHKPVIKICMGTDAASEAHKPNVTHAVEEWTGALVDVAAEPVTRTVEFVALNDASCDAVVNVGNYSPAQTRMGNRPIVYLAKSINTWFGSRTVTLHEFGHAFGLYDTYAGSGGSCQRNQPNSVMCRASYENLKQDDIDGIRVAYKNALARNFAADDVSLEMTVE